jgi:hypothetical protein
MLAMARSLTMSRTLSLAVLIAATVSHAQAQTRVEAGDRKVLLRLDRGLVSLDRLAWMVENG